MAEYESPWWTATKKPDESALSQLIATENNSRDVNCHHHWLIGSTHSLTIEVEYEEGFDTFSPVGLSSLMCVLKMGLGGAKVLDGGAPTRFRPKRSIRRGGLRRPPRRSLGAWGGLGGGLGGLNLAAIFATGSTISDLVHSSRAPANFYVFVKMREEKREY